MRPPRRTRGTSDRHSPASTKPHMTTSRIFHRLDANIPAATRPSPCGRFTKRPYTKPRPRMQTGCCGDAIARPINLPLAYVPVGTHRDASATPHPRHLRPTLTRTTQTAHDDLTHITSPGCQHTGRIVPIHMRTFRETSLHESQTAYVNPDVAGVPSRGQSTIGWPTSL